MDDMEEFLGNHDIGVAVRLCMPVVDAPDIAPEPGSMKMPCSFCKQACWYDSTLVLPLPEGVPELVVCNHCAMHNNQLCAALMAFSWPGSQPPSWN